MQLLQNGPREQEKEKIFHKIFFFMIIDMVNDFLME